MTVVTDNRDFPDGVEAAFYYPILAGLLDVKGTKAAGLLADTDIYEWLRSLALEAFLGVDPDGVIRKVRRAIKSIASALYFDDDIADGNVWTIDELGGMTLSQMRHTIWSNSIVAQIPYAVSDVDFPLSTLGKLRPK